MKYLKTYYRSIFTIGICIIICLFNIRYLVSLKKCRDINAILSSEIANKTIKGNDDILYINKLLLFENKFENRINKRSIDTILTGNSKVVLLLSKAECSQCVLRVLMNMDILAEQVGGKRIVIAGDFDDENAFKNSLPLKNINFKYILFKNLFSYDFILNEPVLFILEPNYNIKVVYFIKYRRQNEYNINVKIENIIIKYFNNIQNKEGGIKQK